MSINGTKSNNNAYLLGVVKSYIPYVDVGISPQTHRARVTFEENSGLAEVVPVDRINEAIKTRLAFEAATAEKPSGKTPAKP